MIMKALRGVDVESWSRTGDCGSGVGGIHRTCRCLVGDGDHGLGNMDEGEAC